MIDLIIWAYAVTAVVFTSAVVTRLGWTRRTLLVLLLGPAVVLVVLLYRLTQETFKHMRDAGYAYKDTRKMSLKLSGHQETITLPVRYGFLVRAITDKWLVRVVDVHVVPADRILTVELDTDVSVVEALLEFSPAIRVSVELGPDDGPSLVWILECDESAIDDLAREINYSVEEDNDEL